MQTISVSSDGTADFATINAALAAADVNDAVHVFIYNGVYREKLVCSHPNATLEGESREATLITCADGAKHFGADGKPLGTFRTQTALFDGEKITVKNLTIANTAGDGRIHGQAIAAAVYSKYAHFENVELLSCQDTLFTGPLPEKERLPNGFLGPHQFTPRINTTQYYKNCVISGDIDFIFGGADAFFDGCTLHCRDRGEDVNGYIAAPSTPKGGMGYVFNNCDISGEAPYTFFLARPWRSHGRAAFINCTMGDVIRAEGFDDWNDAKNRSTAVFAEYGSVGEGASPRRAFGRQLTEPQAKALLAEARDRCTPDR